MALYTTITLHPMWLDDNGLTGRPIPPGSTTLLRVIQQRPWPPYMEYHADIWDIHTHPQRIGGGDHVRDPLDKPL
jgi:hypothetical protein